MRFFGLGPQNDKKNVDVIHLTERNRSAVVEKVVSLLKRGGVVAVPTDTVYGLIADTLRPDAVRKVFRIKARSHAKALPVFVRDVAEARQYVFLERGLAPLLDSMWPGQTTVVLRKKPVMPDLVTGGSRTVGLRVPDHPFLKVLLECYPHPLTATSANLSGSEPASSAVDIQKIFRNHIPRPDLLIDAGKLPPSPSSTVLDMTNPKNPRILRMGAITKEQLDAILNQRRAGNKNDSSAVNGK